MSNSKFVIDFDGFPHENSFMIREFAIVEVDRYETWHYLILPPYNLSLLGGEELKQVYCSQKDYHKIDWNNGFLEYHELFPILHHIFKNAEVLYVKGGEKAAFLQQVTGKYVVDLDEIGCPPASCIPTSKILMGIGCAYKPPSNQDEESDFCCIIFARKYKTWLKNSFFNPTDELDVLFSKCKL